MVPVAEAQVGNTEPTVPAVDPAVCPGCRFHSVCSRARKAGPMRIEAVPGTPGYCRLLDSDVVGCRLIEVGQIIDSGPAPTGGRGVTECWLVDANVFIDARKGDEACRRILGRGRIRLELATSHRIRAELKDGTRVPRDLKVLEAGPIAQELVDLANSNATRVAGKKASIPDLSMVQLLLDYPQLKGIITRDRDFDRIHPQSLVRKRTGRTVRVMTPDKFLATHAHLFKGRPTR